jgi:23S rRNA G2445 N2-methylase RlmL
MNKYEELWKYLQKDGNENIKLTFEEIKEIVGIEIDHSFLTYKKESKEYGYIVGKISLKEKNVQFNKI